MFRTRLFAVAAFAALAFAVSTPARAQDAISVSVLSVDDSAFPQVSAVVTADRGGIPISSPRLSDVFIEESGAATLPTALHRATDVSLPIALVVIMDVSGTMAGEPLAKAQSSAISLVNSLRPGDQAAVVAFSDSVWTEHPLSPPGPAVTNAIARLSVQDRGTSLYDGVAEGARIGASAGLPRRAVVLLSDGKEFGEHSRFNREQSLAVAAQSRAPFYVVGVGTDFDREYLQQLAQRTNGRLFEAFGAANVPAVYSTVEELLRGYFVVTFQATSRADLPARTIRVTLADAGGSGSVQTEYESLRAPRGLGPGLISGAAPAIAAAALVAIGFWALRRRRRHTRARRAVEAPPGSEPIAVARGGPSPTPQPEAAIVIMSGPYHDRAYPVGPEPLTIGSSEECDIPLPPALGVAEEHARVWLRDGRIMIHHLAARHETRVGGKGVTWATLKTSDEIVIGPHVLRCVARERAPQPDRDGRIPSPASSAGAGSTGLSHGGEVTGHSIHAR